MDSIRVAGHLFVHQINNGVPEYFPMQNYSVGNPDGDIQFQFGTVNTAQRSSLILLDPKLVNLRPSDVVHPNVQAVSMPAAIFVDTVREYSELAAVGWNIDYATLSDSDYATRSPLAQWYETCFDSNGVFTTANNKNCKFSVDPADLKLLQ